MSPYRDHSHIVSEARRGNLTCRLLRTAGTVSSQQRLSAASSAPPPPDEEPHDDGSEITALVLFTPAAIDAIGGSENMLPIAQIYETDTNMVFENSPPFGTPQAAPVRGR